MVNIFIAFMLPKEASSDMEKVAEDVKELFLPNGKDEKFFHCTLLFIGRVAEEYIPFIQEKMKSIAAVQKPITIGIDDIGYFFSTKKDRIKVAQGGLSVAGRCRCLTKDSNTSIEKEGYIPYSLQA